MNKEEFLEKLKKELSILNDKEKEDIIEEYKDTIEEKVKHGQTEEEAVKDFGDVDELVSEILDAYKINPEYKENGSFSKFTSEGEKLIKKGANKLADMTRDFADNIRNNDAEMNLNLAFEIIIKVFFTLIILAILTVPLRFFANLGFSFADTFFSPFSFIIKIIVAILFVALYLSIGLLVIISLFKQYFKKDNINVNNEEKEEVKEEYKEEITKPEKKSPENKEVKIIQRNGPTVGSVFLLILKIWVIIFILFPLFCIDICSVFGLVLSIFYWIKGINLFGLTMLLLGISSLFIWFTLLIFNLTFSKGKTSIIPFFIGLIIVVFGALFFIDMVTNIEYIDEAPKTYQKETITQNFTSNKSYYINYNLNGDITKKIDNTMKDNELKLKITYIKDNADINIYNEPEYNFPMENCTYSADKHICENTYNYISLSYDYSDNYNYEKNRLNEFIDNLKDNKIYNYSKLSEVDVQIIANENTMKLIETN